MGFTSYLRRIMEQKSYISVILPLKLEWEPCYALPTRGPQSGNENGTQVEVRTGDRVRVPFAGKEYCGVVSATDIEPQTAPSRIKDIISVEKDLERIREEEISLWRAVAQYYLCTTGEVYKAAYPTMKTNLEEARAAAVQKARIRRERLLDSMREKTARLQTRLAQKEKEAEAAKEGTKKRATLQQAADRLRKEVQTAMEALAAAEGGPDVEADGGIVPTEGRKAEHASRIGLTKAQEEAYRQVKESFKILKPVLLHGVTGSGKTEIYIKLAEDALNEGRNVLYLVPEIALSRQLTERLREHFEDRLLTFSSGESQVSRRYTAEKVRKASEGQTGYIVLGTRSSIFLPHNNLGLIIVDEEHDSSYKQDSPAPRYNGRDTALMLSVIHRCGIILGSATPSLEEMYNCGSGRHTPVILKERFHGSEDAEVEIIDTNAERKKRGMCGSFSRKLIDSIKATLAEGGQVMILRSRRAWAPALQCEECGEIQKCPHCNVSLSYHKKAETALMKCHYCGHTKAYTGTCGKCGGALKSLGAGTQKIEEEATALFPGARIARLDSDTARNRNNEARIIRDFAAGETDILIGTQILTKGFDFSNLRLTAVIAADAMLGIQDFRADEKALQLLEQFRGRCGRRGSRGKLIIQTSQTEHPVYQGLANNDLNLFNNGLMMERKAFDFPPYSRIIELTFKDRYEDRAERMASKLAALLRQATSGMQITGPYAPVVDKIAEQHIRCIRISMRKDRSLKANKAALKEAVQRFEKEMKYDGHITINVDPA